MLAPNGKMLELSSSSHFKRSLKDLIPESSKVSQSKRQKKNILQQNMNHSIQSFSSIPSTLRQILESPAGYTNCTATIKGAGFILVSLTLESKNRIYLWETQSDFYSEYDLPKDTSFTSDMVQLIPSFSNSGFGLVASTSDSTIYYWKDIAQQGYAKTQIEMGPHEKCTRLCKLDHETIAITTLSDENANIYLVSLKNQCIAFRSLTTPSQRLSYWVIGWLLSKNLETPNRILNLHSQIMHDDIIRMYVLCERSNSFFLQSWIIAFLGSDSLEVEFPLSEAIFAFIKPHQGVEITVLDFYFSGANDMYVLYYVPQFRQYSIAIFDVTSRSVSNVIPIVNDSLMPKIGFHVNIQDSQVDFFVWLNSDLYITSFDRFSTLMQSHIDHYSDAKGIIGGGPSNNGDLLLISKSSLEVLECKTLYRKPLLGLLEKRKETEENLINSITEADLVNVEFQIKMLSSMFKDYCSSQAQQLSGFSKKTATILRYRDLTEACNRICLAVLNGYISTEEDWFKLDFQSVTPSLGVEKLLTEKRKKFAIMIACLSSCDMFYRLPFESRFQLSQYAEMLVCSLRLNEYCNDDEFVYVTKGIISSAMESTLKKNHLIDTANHPNISSFFFSQVILIFPFLIELFGEYKKEMSTKPQSILDDFHSSLSYSINELFFRLFSSVLDHRERNKSVYLTNDEEISRARDFANNWTNITSLIHILKELCEISWSHLKGCENEPIRNLDEEMDVVEEIPSHRNQIFCQLFNFYSIIFSQLKEQSNQDGDFIDLTQDNYEEYKIESIGKLVAAKQYGYAILLAEQNEEFETLVFVCEETSHFSDGQKELAKYAQKFLHRGFPEVLFKWYLSQGRIKKLVDNFPFLDTQREKFLKKNDPKLLWLFYLRIGKFGECNKQTPQLAQTTENLFEKRYLLSVGCLCAQLDNSNSSDTTVKPVVVHDEDSYQSRHRELIDYQLRVAEESQRPELKTQILTTRELIDATISIAHPPHLLDVASIFSIYNLSSKDHSYEEKLSLLVHSCRRTLLLDDWEYFAEQAKTLDERTVVEQFWDKSYLVQLLRSDPSLMCIITPKLLLKIIKEEYSVEACEAIQSAYAMVFSESSLPVK